MGMFDSILSATEARMSGAPVVLAEEHNVGAINWVAGLSDPGEMIRCGYLPEIRRRAGEADAEYQARIEPIVRKLPQADQDRIMRAAVSRASLDTSTGRVAVMVAGEAARKALWHRLGVQVRDAVTSADAIRLASLNWSVKKLPTAYQWEGVSKAMLDTFALVRGDTGAHLGTVGTRYAPIQNAEAFSFLDAVLAEHGARYETAGAVHGGKRVWMQVSLPEGSFTLPGGDSCEATALFTNPHDGSGVARCIPTSVRVVCANTLRVATGSDAGLKIRHTGSVRGKLDDARRALGLAVRGFDVFKGQAEAMQTAALPQPAPFFNGVLDAVLDITEAKLKVGAEGLANADILAGIIKGQDARTQAVKEYTRAIDNRRSILEDIIERYHSQRNGVAGMRGSVWGAFNAVTEHADHADTERRKVGSEHDRLSRRFESTLSGERDELKQTALVQAVALTR